MLSIMRNALIMIQVHIYYCTVAGHTLLDSHTDKQIIDKSTQFLMQLAIDTFLCMFFFSLCRNANSMDLSSCSIQQKSALYIIANSSFSVQKRTARIYYELIRPYLGNKLSHSKPNTMIKCSLTK